MSNAVSERNLVSVILRLLQASDVDTATEIYEERGRSIAEQLLVKLQASEPLIKSGAKMYEQARDFARAARLYEHVRHWPDAARLWEEAGDLAAAARCWKKAGDPEKAAAALHASGNVEDAAEIYASLNQPDQQATVLAKKERWLESAAAYRAAGNARAETDALRGVALDHPDRVPAVKRLAEILLERNRTSEAAQLVAETLRENSAGRVDVELHALMAQLFDQLGQGAQAERLRARAERLRARETAPAQEMAAAESHHAEEETQAAQEAPAEGYRFLKKVPIFARLAIEDMRDLYRLMTEVTWKPGQQIVDAGIDAPGLIVLLEGDAEVYALTDDGPRHLNSVGPGAHLGEISLLSNSVTSARVTATTLARGLHLSKESFDQFMATHSMAALRIYKLFSEKLAERVRALSLG